MNNGEYIPNKMLFKGVHNKLRYCENDKDKIEGATYFQRISLKHYDRIQRATHETEPVLVTEHIEE